jgi:hypothetical protein
VQSSAGPEPGELGYCAWFGFWVPLLALGFVAIIGASFASADRAPGDDICGLTLSLAAVALVFLRVKQRFDGGSLDWGSFLFVDNAANLVLAIVAFAILGLGGLIAAARVEYGGLHDGGIALFVVSAFGVFFSTKHVFDNLDRR